MSRLPRTAGALFVMIAASACGRIGFEAAADDVADAGGNSSPRDAASSVEIRIGERSGALGGLTVDTTIKNYDAADNFETEQFLGAHAPEQGIDSTPGLLRFDLSSLAAGTVLEARLLLAAEPGLNDSLTEIVATELLESWVAVETNYNERSDGNAWSVPGAAGAARGTRIGSVSPDPGSAATELALDLDIVRQWLADPSANHGMVLTSGGDAAAGAWLASSDHFDEGLRPLLVLRIAE